MNILPTRYQQNSLLSVASYPSYSSLDAKIELTVFQDSVVDQESFQAEASSTNPICDNPTWFHCLFTFFLHKQVHWLRQDAALYDEPDKTVEEREHRSLAGCIRHWVYDPVGKNNNNKVRNYYLMALYIGVAVGLHIVVFKLIIERGLDLIWDTIPHALDHVFDQLGLPMFLYVPIIMSTGSAVCGVLFEKLSADGMPDKNSLLNDLHQNGRLSCKHLCPLICLSTIAMWSGLPLGPELPLLIIFAMFGSEVSEILGLDAEQSRFLLYFSMSAAIGAFFHFPIGAFMFVMEVPHRTGVFHRMGRLHAQLIGPCATASLSATIVHCYVTGKPVERLFSLPHMPENLSCTIPIVVFLAVYIGNGFGQRYLTVTTTLKKAVHGVADHLQPTNSLLPKSVEESKITKNKHEQTDESDYFSLQLDNRGQKATIRIYQYKLLVHGITCWFVGIVVSMVCLVLPHCFSWGEAQLQNLFDNGTSELPFFGKGSNLLSPYATCMPNKEGLSIGCLIAIPIARTFIVGLTLGTGIRCGHFWGPIFGGAAVGQVTVHLLGLVGFNLPYAGLFLMCTMASAHVVIFRSPLGIAFLLMQSAGYDIVASVAVLSAAHISLFLSRDAIFYKSQRDHTPVFADNNSIDTGVERNNNNASKLIKKESPPAAQKFAKSGCIEIHV